MENTNQPLPRLLLFLKKYRVLLTALAVLLVALYIVLSYTILIINIPSNQKNIKASIKTPLQSLAIENGKPVRPGINLVRTGRYTLDVTADNKQSLVDFSAQAVAMNTVDVSLKNQKSVDVAAPSVVGSSCFFESIDFAYSCSGGKIYRTNKVIVNPSNPEQILPDITVAGRPINYRQGILTLGYRSDNSSQLLVLYVTSAQAQVVDRLSSDIGSNPNLIAISKDALGSDRFIVHDSSRYAVRWYTNLEDASPKKYNYRQDLDNSVDDGVASIAGTSLFVNAREEPDHDHSEEDEITHDDITPGIVLKYSVGDDIKLVSTFGTLEIDAVYSSGVFTAITENSLVANGRDSRLAFVTLENNKIEITSRIDLAEDMLIDKGNVYYIQGNSVFKRTAGSNESHLVRTSDHIQLSQPVVSGSSLVMFGSSINQQSTPHYYRVTEDDIQGKEPFDVIPYSLEELPITRSAFMGDELFFAVRLKSFDPVSGSYNNRELASSRAIILSRLTSDGLSPTDFKITLKPGY